MIIFMGIIFVMLFLLLAKLKTDLNIANHKLDQWRDLAIKQNKTIKECAE